jgi:hypothetical protein
MDIMCFSFGNYCISIKSCQLSNRQGILAARLLEEHGVIVALLRLRKTRTVKVEHGEIELQDVIAPVQQELHLAEEKIVR